jgi:Cyclin-dependent kinase regulatory subunit
MVPKSFFENPQRPEVLRLLREDEWRGIGITQSLGWEHYEVHGEPALIATWRHIPWRLNASLTHHSSRTPRPPVSPIEDLRATRCKRYGKDKEEVEQHVPVFSIDVVYCPRYFPLISAAV